MKKTLSITLLICLLLASLSATACTDKATNTVVDENVLRVASWDEYIDMGGEDSYYDPDSLPLYEEFEDWYYEKTGKRITVEYVALQVV